MDYRIRTSADGLGSTGFMELGPGKYPGKHWQPGFVFVWEDAFGMAEGIIARHLPNYDHFGVNDIPRETGFRILEDWESAAKRLNDGMAAADASRMLNLEASFRDGLDDEVEASRSAIASMLNDLVAHLRKFYGDSDSVCILGM